MVDGIFVNGVDMITFENDQIVEFKVMVRPLKAVNAVWKQMGEMLERKRLLKCQLILISSYKKRGYCLAVTPSCFGLLI